MSGNGQQLPAGWVTVMIEDLFAPLNDGRTLHQGWSPQCEKIPSDSENDWGVLKTTAIQSGAFLPEHNKRLPANLTSRPLIEVRAGDILITCAGPRLRCGIACLVRNTRPRLMMSGKMYRFRVPDEHIDARFVEAYLQTAAARDEIDRMKTGGSDSGLNLTHNRFRTLHVPVAPLNEQRRIVERYEELMSDLDAGVAALTRVREKLKCYRTAVLKAAMEGAFTAEWRAQHPNTEPAPELLKRILVERRRRWEEEQLRKFKEKGQDPPNNWKAKYMEPVAPDIANLPPLPESWCWSCGDAFFGFITSGSRGWARFCADEGALFIRMGNLDHDSIRLDLRQIQRVKPPAGAEGLRTRVVSRDILISITADVGMIALVPDDIEEAYINQHVALARPVLPALGSFTAWYLSSPSGGQLHLKDLQRGATKVGLGLDDIRNVAIPLPPLTEQEAIVEAIEDQLSVIDHLESELEDKLKNATALRQAILHQAFSGQLVPQDPNDEPASELLKRIVTERAQRTHDAAAAKRTTKTAKRVRTEGRWPRRSADGCRKKKQQKEN